MPLNRLVDSGIPLPLPDTQRTTFSVDGMARFTCNTWDEILAAQSGGQFDIVIVGSGMYGAYTAAKLFERGRRMGDSRNAPRVLVLESGPFLITEHVQNVTRRSTALGSLVGEDLVEPGQSNQVPFVKHSRCVGGKSLFWGGWSPCYQKEDMDRVDEDGDRVWPEAVEEYLFRSGWKGGYEYSEREIGVYPVQDFINGPLYEALKSRAEAVVNSNQVPSLKTVLVPPIAVQKVKSAVPVTPQASLRMVRTSQDRRPRRYTVPTSESRTGIWKSRCRRAAPLRLNMLGADPMALAPPIMKWEPCGSARTSPNPSPMSMDAFIMSATPIVSINRSSRPPVRPIRP